SGMQAMPEQIELTRRANEYLDAICATSDRAWHLPGPPQTFDAAEMENPFHINRPAAERFTTEVARRLKELGLPR
ncbi:MAG: class I SAM-dependent methyltransferase, partial [Planctomycetota bacterium]